jgi:hypothetical protein
MEEHYGRYEMKIQYYNSLINITFSAFLSFNKHEVPLLQYHSMKIQREERNKA